MTGIPASLMSPRTAAEPMAFTGAEFFRGVAAAWGWAMLLPTLVYASMFGGAGVAGVIFVVPTATAATVLFAVTAWSLGRALRRSPRVGVHMISFAALGAAIGVAATAGYLLSANGRIGNSFDTVLFVVNAACGAAAVAHGWRFTARRALGWRRRRTAPEASPFWIAESAAEDDRARILRERQSEG